MNNFVKSMDNLPLVAKIILCLPVLDLLWAIYRICKGATTKNTLMLVVGIAWIVIGTTITWVIDLVCTIVYKKPVLLA